MTKFQTMLLFINVFVIVMMLSTFMSVEKRHYEDLSRAIVEGCSPSDDRVAMAIENFCTVKHPLTKGTTK